MMKTLFLILIASIGPCCVMAAEQPSAVPKPKWQVGQSWQVKCPIFTFGFRAHSGADGPIDTGKSRTLTYTVLRKEEIGKSEVWAVRINVTTEHQEDTHNFYVYYRTNDMSLMTDPRTSDFFLGKDGAPIYKEGIACPDLYGSSDLLIEMPLFPLVAGKQESRIIYDGKTYDHKGPKPECLLVKSVSRVEPAPEQGEGAVKVTLTWVETDLKSHTSTRDYEEQIWKPGKPWWSSAQVTGRISSAGRIGKRTLIEEGAGK